MVSLLASPSAATQGASSPLSAGTRQLQPWVVSLTGDKVLRPRSVQCRGHGGQSALVVSPSPGYRGLPSIPVTARFNSAACCSLDLRVLAINKLTSSTQRKMNSTKSRRSLIVSCEYGDGSKGSGGGDFFAGFLLGGAIFGTLTYIFAPQIRRSLLNEDEYGFRRPNKPVYYDDGLEKTRQTLNEKISQLNSAIDVVSSRLKLSQLNSAIDNVSSRLRGRGNNVPAKESIEVDSEIEGSEASV